ncbi:hypothetical protein MKX01_035854 [Papaver californicum]|nr:hypothetical protein MKX01_035854 [Papaver californicum]
MVATSKEMDNSYLFLIDRQSKFGYDDEIKVNVNADSTLVIAYKCYLSVDPKWGIKKFDLPQDANLDSISAISLNGTLIVSVSKKTIIKTINQPRTTRRSIRVIKADQDEADDLTN